MLPCCRLNPGIEETTEYKKFDNARMATIALVVVSLAFIILGAMLLQYSMSPSVASKGYAFVFHFVGTHALGFGLLLTLATVASSALTLYRRLHF